MMIRTTISKRDNWYNSFNYQVHTPDATLYIIITEDHDGEPMRVFITGPKNNQPLSLWITAVQNLINHMLETKVHISKVITLLDLPYSPKFSTNANGIRIYSGPDGIKYAFTRYLQDRSSRTRTNLNDVERRLGQTL